MSESKESETKLSQLEKLLTQHELLEKLSSEQLEAAEQRIMSILFDRHVVENPTILERR